MTPPINSDELIRAGAALATAAFNLAQPSSGLSDDVRSSLRRCQEEWDAARRAANTPVDGVEPDIAALLAEPPLPSGLPRAYGGCTCSCHRMPGVMHIAPCCRPGDEQSKPLMTREWFERRSKDEADLDVSVGPASPALPSQVVEGFDATKRTDQIAMAIATLDGEQWVRLSDHEAAMRSCLTSPAAEPFGTAWQTNFSSGKWHFDVKVAFAASDIERGIVHNITPLYTHPAPSASRGVTVTDEMVERAARAAHWVNYEDPQQADHEWHHWSGSADYARKIARAALLAALLESEHP